MATFYPQFHPMDNLQLMHPATKKIMSAENILFHQWASQMRGFIALVKHNKSFHS